MHFQRRQLLRTLSFAFRVELHLGAEPTRHSRADSRAAKALSSPCGCRCSRWDRCRNGNGKSDRNRRILLPSQRSESAGALVPATLGNRADAIELRGFRLGGPTVFAPFEETSAYFGDSHKVWMVNFRVRDLDKMAAQLRTAGIEVKMDPQSYPNGRFARVHDPREIRSNCGSLRFQTPKARLQSSSGLFLDFSWVTS